MACTSTTGVPARCDLRRGGHLHRDRGRRSAAWKSTLALTLLALVGALASVGALGADGTTTFLDGHFVATITDRLESLPEDRLPVPSGLDRKTNSYLTFGGMIAGALLTMGVALQLRRIAYCRVLGAAGRTMACVAAWGTGLAALGAIGLAIVSGIDLLAPSVPLTWAVWIATAVTAIPALTAGGLLGETTDTSALKW